MQNDAAIKIPAFAHVVADAVAELPLLEADQLLDDARRFMWMREFKQIGRAKLEPDLPVKNRDIVLEIIARLDDIVTKLEADKIFYFVRLVIWRRHHGQVV